MQVSDKGLMALICREGIALGWYRDSRGIPTIGIGHTAMAGPPDPVRKGTLTTREAFDLFRVDVEKYAATVRAAIKETMSQDEFDAFVSICYNIGQDGFAKAAFVKKFNAGDRAGCAKAIMNWTKPPEIKGRRRGERDHFLGRPPKSFTATIYEPAPGGKLGRARSIDLVRALQIDAKPPAKPVEPQKPAPAPTEPTPPQPAPQATPAPKGAIAGFATAFLVILAGLFWSTACLLPDFIINWLGYAAKCTGGN